MNNDLISREALKDLLNKYNKHFTTFTGVQTQIIIDLIDHAPTVEAYTEEDMKRTIKENFDIGYEMAKNKYEKPQGEFSRKDLENWLYQIAMNNIGTDFEKSVVEIIHRLDGFERFVSEQKGGVENGN